MSKHPTPGPEARALIARDREVVSPSYPRAFDFVMDHGAGTEVWDVDGNRYLDFAAGIAVCSTGHSHPKVVQAIKDQADKFLHISSDFYHRVWIELSEKLAELAPFNGPGRVFLTNSGTEAVEAAIKLARHHTGRQQFIGFYGAFHGRTLGALAFTASKPVYRRGFMPLMNGVSHAPFPNEYRPILQHDGMDYGEAVVRYIEDVILQYTVPADDCAGILVEPIQGEGGYVVPPPGFFPALRELCDRHGILLIADEVQSGVGRTGKMWAIEHWGVEPDIITSAKGLGSGVPIGAAIARADIMDWPQGAHGNTYGGNPIASAAALATLELVEDELMDNAAEQGEYLLDALAEIGARHPSIGEVRGKGLMIGVEFVKDQTTKEPAIALRDSVEEGAFRGGLLTLSCGKSSIRFSPPLVITRDEIDEGLEIFESALSDAEERHLS
ncbi:MAG: acetyl ornithine aminotransferase family protein [Anaerolineales bacterium]|nr:acetyl ornithine aminotransferase family protein [Anaerolineales bacterium]